MSGQVIVINRSKHSVPVGFFEVTITTPSSLSNPFQPGHHLPKLLLDQVAQCENMARTDAEQQAIRQALNHKGVTSHTQGQMLHLLYLRKACVCDNLLGRGIKQLADKVAAGQKIALSCRCLSTIYRGGETPPEPCHGVNLQRAITGYAKQR